MSRKRSGPILLLAVALTLCACQGASAQGGRDSGGVIFTSVPDGAVVELYGDHVLRGVTPWVLERGLSGTYEIVAYKTGFEEWRGVTVLSETKRDSIHIRLTMKTVVGAGLRSAVLPGWGQFYSEKTTKGVIFLAAEAVAVGGLIWADSKRSDSERNYKNAVRDYQEADQIEDIDDAWDEVLRTYDDLDSWHETRRRWFYAAAGIWAINLIDAVVFSSPRPQGGSMASLLEPEGTGFYASLEPTRTTAGFAIRF